MGRAVAVMAAERGYDLALIARCAPILEQTAALVREVGGAALCLPADVTDAAAVARLMARHMAHFGRLDVLVHSILPPHLFKRILDLTPDDLEDWRKSAEISIFGALLMAHTAAKPMAAAGRGSMVFGTATSGLQSYPAVSAHAVGKAAIHSLMQKPCERAGPARHSCQCNGGGGDRRRYRARAAASHASTNGGGSAPRRRCKQWGPATQHHRGRSRGSNHVPGNRSVFRDYRSNPCRRWRQDFPLNTPSLACRVALVTGTAAGIGRAAALALAKAGAILALVDRDEAGLEYTRGAITDAGGEAAVYPLDLTQGSHIPPLVEAVLRQHGRIDILVNGAGVTGRLTSTLEADEEGWDQVMAVNLKAPFWFIKHVRQAMAAQGGGRIVNITSSSAHRARHSLPAYGASKSDLMQLTRSAAADLGPLNINVNAVAPGLTATRMVSDHFTPESLAASLKDGLSPICCSASLSPRILRPRSCFMRAGQPADHRPNDPCQRRCDRITQAACDAGGKILRDKHDLAGATGFHLGLSSGGFPQSHGLGNRQADFALGDTLQQAGELHPIGMYREENRWHRQMLSRDR
jgi:3-oxoacyl-[acyl-carrier protein] reductase